MHNLWLCCPYVQDEAAQTDVPLVPRNQHSLAWSCARPPDWTQRFSHRLTEGISSWPPSRRGRSRWCVLCGGQHVPHLRTGASTGWDRTSPPAETDAARSRERTERTAAQPPAAGRQNRPSGFLTSAKAAAWQGYATRSDWAWSRQHMKRTFSLTSLLSALCSSWSG